MTERAMLLQRIVIDPEVMAGKPIIRGTRIPVDLIIRLLGQITDKLNPLRAAQTVHAPPTSFDRSGLRSQEAGR